MSAMTMLHSVPPPVQQEQLTAVYRYAVTRGGLPAVSTAAIELGLAPELVAEVVSQLLAQRLLREDVDNPQLLVAVDPELAGRLLVSPLEREIYQRRELIAQVQAQTELFRPDFSRTDRPGQAEISRIAGHQQVRGCLQLAGDSCREEILVLQAGRQDTEDFDELLRLCEQLLERGVSVRIVCQHRSRADLTTRMKLKRVIDAGGQVRTASHLPRAAVVFDRTLAVLVGAESEPACASQIRDESVVGFLLDLFGQLWDEATPVAGADAGYAEAADDLQQAIVAMMARGFTDEVLARKLGMSLRTCRRHIAALMRDLDAVSRFQAGVRAGQTSLVHSA
jgi:DNA-binding CsgD family transcriptional regulator/sugar-specific transcriptional regulator TrmB